MSARALFEYYKTTPHQKMKYANFHQMLHMGTSRCLQYQHQDIIK